MSDQETRLVLVSAADIPLPTHGERCSHERGFRRGYWYGVLEACNHIICGATQHDVRLWLFREVKEWRQSLSEQDASRADPPHCKYGRSYDEATLYTASPKPIPSGGKCFVYAVGDGHGNAKIGIANDVQSRLRSLQTGNASRLYLICYISASCRHSAEKIESWCHHDLREHRACGEWFRVADDVAFQSMFECLDDLGIQADVIEIENRVY